MKRTRQQKKRHKSPGWELDPKKRVTLKLTTGNSMDQRKKKPPAQGER